MNSPITTVRILKGPAAASPQGDPPLEYVDLRRRSQEVLQSARQEADRLLSEARAQADSLRAQATDEGFAAGVARARQTMELQIETLADQRAEQTARQMFGPLLSAVEQLLLRLTRERDEWISAWENRAVELAGDLAERIVGRELAHRPELAAGMLREALSLAAGLPQTALRVHPDDLQLLQSDSAEAAGPPRCKLIPDPSLARGGCIIELESGRIDARVATQRSRLVAEMLDS